ncbi:MAG TPA: orotidine-5'-phosphate decarboxylase [Bryobacteraceae bacterium]|nr:orotidine-5'-phosphate decarboxylase [Bryobacteraceae bacterium]
MSYETNPLIIALDVASADEALQLVKEIGPAAEFYKVGMELYAAAGMDVVRRLGDSGRKVFLDLKLYDIGETVKRATGQILKNEAIQFLTVHGSRSVMQAAVEGKGESRAKLLAVTVLTSFDADDLADLGYRTPVSELVELRVRKAAESGIDGIVCSPLEVQRVREIGGSKMTLVTPGVRSVGAATGDQKRVATPAEALANGADYLVIGRQVTRAADPRWACEEILAEIAESRAELRDRIAVPR